MDDMRCGSCETIFQHYEANQRIETETDEAWGQLTVIHTTILTCPACNSDDIDDHTSCETKGCDQDVVFGCEECPEHFKLNDADGFAYYQRKWPSDLPAAYRPAVTA